MASALETVSSIATAHGLRCVLIGGHAIAFRGHVRATFDVDVAVPQAERDAWKNALAGLGYATFNEQDAFIQFRAPVKGAWPIDLMLVDAATFDQLSGEADVMTVGGARLQVASRKHLIGMKIHALKARLEHRWSKDLLDVFELASLEAWAIEGDELRALFEKFGDDALYEEAMRAAPPRRRGEKA